MPRYDARRIESKWQAYWEAHGTFVTANTPPPESNGKLYILDMFPYPSGAGLHVGHPEGYTATDIVCRAARMRGKHVLHPMGWDAFGLPAEQHAIKTGTHPQTTTEENIRTFRRQLKMLGFSYDWSRELSTTDEGYYRWTQWIFLQLYDTWFDRDCVWTGPDGKTHRGRGRPISELPIPDDVMEIATGLAVHLKGAAPSGATGAARSLTRAEAVRLYQDAHRLAYQNEAPVNWCPVLGTVLANEEVLPDGTSEVGGHPVERRPLRQWMLRITAYAERLLGELDDLDWSESIKLLQRNWIGRSTGAEVDFLVPRPESFDGPESRAGSDGTGASADAGQATAAFDQWRQVRARSGFPAAPEADVLRVYTTRPDTLFGATYMVVAPEHPLVDRITTSAQRGAVDAYRRQAMLKTDLDRTDLAKDKTGVFTGAFAINPVNGAQIPIWIADYVLISYGTGAIMAVPAHDERDLEFARAFALPVKEVVEPPAELGVAAVGFTGEGTAIHSGRYNGLPTAEFKRQITADLAAQGMGREAVNYRLRDWLFSRQRYWGEPFPLWHELDECGNPTGLIRPVTLDELPVTLPEMEDFRPKGTPDPPLSWAPAEWLYATAADGTRLKRETNSMPQWAGSCWYYLRFCDNRNAAAFVAPEIEQYWMPVDLYVGGAEHAVLHLLYSRFWHKVLFDRGHVSTAEPFRRLVNQGMILGETEFRICKDAGTGRHLTAEEAEQADAGTVVTERVLESDVVKKGDVFVLKSDPTVPVEARAFKMSKSRGNVINPDEIVSRYGADSLRLYEMFMGPLEQVKPWSMSGVEGVFRFLGRVWRLFVDERQDAVVLDAAVRDVAPTAEQERVLHRTVRVVTDDIDSLSFNTAISRLMEFTNFFTGVEPRPRQLLEPFVLLLAPFAPHLAEELWELLGHRSSLASGPWPTCDESKLLESEMEVPVQINGKVRAKIRVPAESSPTTMQELAEADASVRSHLDGKQIVKVVAIPGRMLNFVVK